MRKIALSELNRPYHLNFFKGCLLQILLGDMVCLNRSYHLKNFKGWLPQILLGPSFNTLSHLWRRKVITTVILTNFSQSELFLEIEGMRAAEKKRALEEPIWWKNEVHTFLPKNLKTTYKEGVNFLCLIWISNNVSSSRTIYWAFATSLKSNFKDIL